MSHFKLRKVWKILFLLLLSCRPRTLSEAISNLGILINLKMKRLNCESNSEVSGMNLMCYQQAIPTQLSE